MTISKPVLCAFILLVYSFIPLSFAPSVQAQVPKGDVYLGYSRTGTDTFYPNVGGLNGWEGALHIKLHKPFLGIEGDVAHYGLGANFDRSANHHRYCRSQIHGGRPGSQGLCARSSGRRTLSECWRADADFRRRLRLCARWRAGRTDRTLFCLARGGRLHSRRGTLSSRRHTRALQHRARLQILNGGFELLISCHSEAAVGYRADLMRLGQTATTYWNHGVAGWELRTGSCFTVNPATFLPST